MSRVFPEQGEANRQLVDAIARRGPWDPDGRCTLTSTQDFVDAMMLVPDGGEFDLHSWLAERKVVVRVAREDGSIV